MIRVVTEVGGGERKEWGYSLMTYFEEICPHPSKKGMFFGLKMSTDFNQNVHSLVWFLRDKFFFKSN